MAECDCKNKFNLISKSDVRSSVVVITHILSLFILTASFVEAKTLAKVVGAVGDHYVTSRECEAMQFLERLLSEKKEGVVLRLNDPGFDRVVTGVLLERIIAAEAEDFSVAAIADAEVEVLFLQAKSKLEKDEFWQKLDLKELELRSMISTKLRAKKFIKYKTDSASIPITDSEAKGYFDKNRNKFGNLPFANFKENIKSFLSKQQLEGSLKEWFEILNRKYQLRNFESETVVAQ